MRAALAAAWLLLAALAQPAVAELRRPSCQVLVSLTDSMRREALQYSFGKRFDDMTATDLAQALEIVTTCLDTASARPPERPGLMRFEQRSTQIYLLSVLSEELRFLRSRAIERDGVARAGNASRPE